jgi:hypothetical protein
MILTIDHVRFPRQSTVSIDFSNSTRSAAVAVDLFLIF